jgi:hypothetical protein
MTKPFTAEVPLTTVPVRTATAVANDAREGMVDDVVVVDVAAELVADVDIVVVAVTVVGEGVGLTISVVPTPMTPHPTRAPELPASAISQLISDSGSLTYRLSC